MSPCGSRNPPLRPFGSSQAPETSHRTPPRDAQDPPSPPPRHALSPSPRSAPAAPRRILRFPAPNCREPPGVALIPPRPRPAGGGGKGRSQRGGTRVWRPPGTTPGLRVAPVPPLSIPAPHSSQTDPSAPSTRPIAPLSPPGVVPVPLYPSQGPHSSSQYPPPASRLVPVPPAPLPVPSMVRVHTAVPQSLSCVPNTDVG